VLILLGNLKSNTGLGIIKIQKGCRIVVLKLKGLLWRSV
jgi:hypothetical protein